MKVIPLVFNADDFGLAPSVNRSIITAFQYGLLKSASVMVNMPFAEEALSDLQKTRESLPIPVPGLGLHFCITSGRPVLPPQEVPLLVNREGLFSLNFGSLLRFIVSSRRRELLDQIQMEFNAQFQRADQLIMQYGFVNDHLDSHQHIHSIPGIWPLLRSMADKRSLVLRRPHEVYGSFVRFLSSLRKRFPSGIAKKYILDGLLACSRSSSNDSVCSCGYFGIIDTGHMDENSIREISVLFSRRTIISEKTAFEINLHPWNLSENELEQLVCSADDRKFASSPWRQKEWNALTNPDVLQKILVQYHLEARPFYQV